MFGRYSRVCLFHKVAHLVEIKKELSMLSLIANTEEIIYRKSMAYPSSKCLLSGRAKEHISSKHLPCKMRKADSFAPAGKCLQNGEEIIPHKPM